MLSTTARYVSCADGDTITVRNNPEIARRLNSDKDEVRVRFFGIDAPELGQEPWGDRAHNHVELILRTHKHIGLRIFDVDQYGRVCAEVNLSGRSGTTHCLNHYLLSRGYVVAYRRWLGVHGQRGLYLPLEAAAKRDRLGFWAQNPRDIVLPKKYRWLNRR